MTYGTRRFQSHVHKGFLVISILSRINHIPRISCGPILILPSDLRLGLPRGLFSSGLRVKISKEVLYSFILATSPPYPY